MHVFCPSVGLYKRRLFTNKKTFLHILSESEENITNVAKLRKIKTNYLNFIEACQWMYRKRFKLDITV